MRSQFPLGVVAVLMTIVAGSVSVATAGEPGRLQALAEREQLRDDVCIAMADGKIDNMERYEMLSHAKVVLKPEEYEGFKRALARLSPPTPVKHASRAGPAKSAQMAQQKAPSRKKASPAPAKSREIIVTDEIASTAKVR